jgi:hypothetical protein
VLVGQAEALLELAANGIPWKCFQSQLPLHRQAIPAWVHGGFRLVWETTKNGMSTLGTLTSSLTLTGNATPAAKSLTLAKQQLWRVGQCEQPLLLQLVVLARKGMLRNTLQANQLLDPVCVNIQHTHVHARAAAGTAYHENMLPACIHKQLRNITAQTCQALALARSWVQLVGGLVQNLMDYGDWLLLLRMIMRSSTIAANIAVMTHIDIKSRL